MKIFRWRLVVVSKDRVHWRAIAKVDRFNKGVYNAKACLTVYIGGFHLC